MARKIAIANRHADSINPEVGNCSLDFIIFIPPIALAMDFSTNSG
ncbi:hypothetical protein [Phormidium sp. CCY1219]|nr:hypothetical protein [Phormidium sp. CCY1219]